MIQADEPYKRCDVETNWKDRLRGSTRTADPKPEPQAPVSPGALLAYWQFR